MDSGHIAALVFAVIAGFIILREVICWYFKINARLSVSRDILTELKLARKSQLTDKQEAKAS
jgi:hypothetical protein